MLTRLKLNFQCIKLSNFFQRYLIMLSPIIIIKKFYKFDKYRKIIKIC